MRMQYMNEALIVEIWIFRTTSQNRQNTYWRHKVKKSKIPENCISFIFDTLIVNKSIFKNVDFLLFLSCISWVKKKSAIAIRMHWYWDVAIIVVKISRCLHIYPPFIPTSRHIQEHNKFSLQIGNLHLEREKFQSSILYIHLIYSLYLIISWGLLATTVACTRPRPPFVGHLGYVTTVALHCVTDHLRATIGKQDTVLPSRRLSVALFRMSEIGSPSGILSCVLVCVDSLQEVRLV